MSTECTMVVDTSNLAYRFMFANGFKKTDGEPTGHILGFLNWYIKTYSDLHQFKDSGWVGNLVFALDRRPTRKLDLYPEYKANRKKRDTYNPVPDIERLLRYMGCTTIHCDGEEADDVMASYVACSDSTNIVVVSSDKDMYQLVERGRVRQQATVGGFVGYVSHDDLYDAYGLHRFQDVPLWKAVFGDSGDNIKPVVPRLRKKVVTPIINGSHGTIQSFYEHMFREDIPDDIRKKLTTDECRKKLEMNMEIIKLKTDVNHTVTRYKLLKGFLMAYLNKKECVVDGIETIWSV